jgi:membrane protein YqaA with SNARE-associated domain
MIREELHQLEAQYQKEVNGIVQKSGQLLRSKYGLWVLAAITFVDSALAFPGPVDPFLAAYIMANRQRAVLAVVVTVLASLIGGVMLYLFAAFFTEQLLSFLSPQSFAAFNQMVQAFDKGTFMLTFLGAFTPIPYGFVAIAAGALKGSLLMFVAGSIAGRALRFGVVGYLTYYFGEKALTLAKNNLKLATIAIVGLMALYLCYKIYF